MMILLPPSEKKSPLPGSAISVYTGVLYTALGWESLNSSQRKLGQASIRIISAKYAALRPLDEIQTYKEKINNAKMRPLVARILNPIDPDLIIDCRSSTYQSVWQSPAKKTVEVKVFTKVDGVKKVITHMSKKTRGEVTRLLLQAPIVAKTPQQLWAIVSKDFECALIPCTENQPWVLEVYC